MWKINDNIVGNNSAQIRELRIYMVDFTPPQMFVNLMKDSQEICLLAIPSAKILLKEFYLFFSLFFKYSFHTRNEKCHDSFLTDMFISNFPTS